MIKENFGLLFFPWVEIFPNISSFAEEVFPELDCLLADITLSNDVTPSALNISPSWEWNVCRHAMMHREEQGHHSSILEVHIFSSICIFIIFFQSFADFVRMFGLLWHMFNVCVCNLSKIYPILHLSLKSCWPRNKVDIVIPLFNSNWDLTNISNNYFTLKLCPWFNMLLWLVT